jgi:hypothetical protein
VEPRNDRPPVALAPPRHNLEWRFVFYDTTTTTSLFRVSRCLKSNRPRHNGGSLGLADEQMAAKRAAIAFYNLPAKPLRLSTPILGSFTAKSLYCLIRNLTLNQRVQGSSPCAPTN